MGWHKSPPGWKLDITEKQLTEEKQIERRYQRERRNWTLRRKNRPVIDGIDNLIGQARVTAGRWRRKFLRQPLP